MKKNILLVQSLLVLPLMTSSFVLCMDEKATYAEVTQKGTSLPKQTLAQKSKKAIAKEKKAAAREKAHASKWLIKEFTTEDKANAQEDLDKANALAWSIAGLSEVLAKIKEIESDNPTSYHTFGSEVNARHKAPEKTKYEVLNSKTTPTAVTENTAPKIVKMDVSTDLEQSALTSLEKPGFSLSSSFFNAFKTYTQVVIKLIETKEFDQFNGTHKQYFNAALEECAQRKDIDSLEKMLKACQSKEEYQSLQSAVHHVAPAFNYVSNQYQAQIVASNKDLAAYNQELAQQINDESAQLKEAMTKLLSQHREKVTALSAAFDARVKTEQEKELRLKNLITGVAALNAKASVDQNKIVETYRLTIPTNNVGMIEDVTHQAVRFHLTRSNMPQASVLQIDNK